MELKFFRDRRSRGHRGVPVLLDEQYVGMVDTVDEFDRCASDTSQSVLNTAGAQWKVFGEAIHRGVQ